ncbi:hypothetical protein LCGC14_1739720 [marine sediment metagenome]|uniref:Uncharacterized protein n=1 Tax=marine sediment metagenome TaxID=412755 RepID=A0A0F9K6S0_9ZZZZ
MDREMYDVISNLVNSFKARDLEPPDCLVLKSCKEGLRFMNTFGMTEVALQVGGTGPAGIVVGPNGRPFARVYLYGIKIMWPIR